MTTVTVGIDYSLTSPCVCVSRDKTFSNSFFYFLNDRKTVQGKVHNILGEQHDEYMTDQERYENIASWVMGILADFKKEEIVIIIENNSRHVNVLKYFGIGYMHTYLHVNDSFRFAGSL